MPSDKIIAFLSQPYGRTNEERVYWGNFRAAIKKVAESFKAPHLEIICGDEHVRALLLTEHVRKLINSSDFTIAVITGSNPNVLWEIGYTDGQDKPVVILSDDDDPAAAQSPVLLSEILRCPYRSTMLTQLAMTGNLPEDFTQTFKRFLEQAIQLSIARRIPSIAQIRANRMLCDLASIIADANRCVYLITTNLGYFADFENFTVTRSEMQYAFDPPVDRGVDVKILTLDPESPLVQYRARQLGLRHDVADYREKLRDSARRMYLRYRNNRNVTIRVYDDLPLQITAIVDDIVVSSVMGSGRQARFNIHFIINKLVPGVTETFEWHFQQVSAGASENIGAFGWALK